MDFDEIVDYIVNQMSVSQSESAAVDAVVNDMDEQIADILDDMEFDEEFEGADLPSAEDVRNAIWNDWFKALNV